MVPKNRGTPEGPWFICIGLVMGPEAHWDCSDMANTKKKQPPTDEME